MPDKDKEPTCVWEFVLEIGGVQNHKSGCGLRDNKWMPLYGKYCPHCGRPISHNYGKRLEVKDV